MSGERFLMFPKRLARLVEDGEINVRQLGMVAYYGAAGADLEEGFAETGYEGAARRFGVSPSTAKRDLQLLRKLALLKFEVRKGQRTPFRIFLGDNARPRSAPRPSHTPPMVEVVVEDVVEVLPYVTSTTTSTENGADPASHAGSTSVTTSTNEAEPVAHTETETETDTETESDLPPDRTLTRQSGSMEALESASLEEAIDYLEALHLRGWDRGSRAALLKFRELGSGAYWHVVDAIEAKRRDGAGIGNEAGYAYSILESAEAGYGFHDGTRR